jgi:hypothetical protein
MPLTSQLYIKLYKQRAQTSYLLQSHILLTSCTVYDIQCIRHDTILCNLLFQGSTHGTFRCVSITTWCQGSEFRYGTKKLNSDLPSDKVRTNLCAKEVGLNARVYQKVHVSTDTIAYSKHSIAMRARIRTRLVQSLQSQTRLHTGPRRSVDFPSFIPVFLSTTCTVLLDRSFSRDQQSPSPSPSSLLLS